MKTQNTQVPRGMKKLHETSMKCIVSLVKKGYKIDEAEKMVLETLKESEPYIKNGMINETVLSLQMIYLDFNLK